MTIAPHDLSRQAQAVQQLLAALKDIIGEDEDFAADVIEGQTDFVEIVNLLIAQEGEDTAMINGIQDYIDKLTHRALNINARIERRRNALLSAFQTAGIKGSLRCALGTVGLRSTPQKAIPTDEKLIPNEFWKPRDPTLDKKALLAALKDGRTIPGAMLSNGGVTISIRTT
jgi:Siphovirus Gp157